MDFLEAVVERCGEARRVSAEATINPRAKTRHRRQRWSASGNRHAYLINPAVRVPRRDQAVGSHAAPTFGPYSSGAYCSESIALNL
jgi:hypothetical protein